MSELFFLLALLIVPIVVVSIASRLRRAHPRFANAMCPTCPYCPHILTGAHRHGLPAEVILNRGAHAWCGSCGALYRAADGIWRRPDPARYASMYRRSAPDHESRGTRDH